MVKWTVRAIQVGSIELDRSAMTHFNIIYSKNSPSSTGGR